MSKSILLMHITIDINCNHDNEENMQNGNDRKLDNRFK